MLAHSTQSLNVPEVLFIPSTWAQKPRHMFAFGYRVQSSNSSAKCTAVGDPNSMLNRVTQPNNVLLLGVDTCLKSDHSMVFLNFLARMKAYIPSRCWKQGNVELELSWGLPLTAFYMICQLNILECFNYHSLGPTVGDMFSSLSGTGFKPTSPADTSLNTALWWLVYPPRQLCCLPLVSLLCSWQHEGSTDEKPLFSCTATVFCLFFPGEKCIN